MTQSDKDLAKIAEDATPRRYAEISPVKVKDTNLLNNKLPPPEILCESVTYPIAFFTERTPAVYAYMWHCVIYEK